MIVLVDCNAFFCSCERLFRPDLWFAPVGVLSNNDGCFISRTKELKALGVKMGQPFFQVKDLCEQKGVHTFSANFALYTNISQRVFSLLKEESSKVEAYSIDEGFLEIEFDKKEHLESWGVSLRQRIFREIGIPVSVGIAQTKVLAKVANAKAKKIEIGDLKGVCVLDSERAVDEVLRDFNVEDIWGVGSKSALKLKGMGIHTAWQLKRETNTFKIQKSLTKVGRMIQDELRGISCFRLEVCAQKKKNITSSRSFGELIYDKDALKEAVAHFLEKACVKLRRQKSSCSTLGVFFRTSPFRKEEFIQKAGLSRLESATQDTRKLIQEAWKIIDQEFVLGHGYAKAGIGLYDLCDQDEIQLTIFHQGDRVEDLILMDCMDRLNEKEGEGMLRSMACGTQRQFSKTRQEKKSPRYVSGWSELALVKC